MIKPFSAFKFFLENKKKGLMTFLVLIFTVCAIALITALINSIGDSVNETSLKMFEHFSFVSTADSITGLPDNIDNQLKSDEDIESLIPIKSIDYTSVTLAISGNTSVPVCFTDRDGAEKLLTKTGDFLKEGRLPDSDANEIAVHWKVMNNKGWKIGDTVGKENDEEEYLAGSYKIVGVIDGSSVVGIGGKSYTLETLKKLGVSTSDLTLAYIVVPKSDKLDDVNRMLDGFDKKKVAVTTYSSMKKMIDKIMGSLSTTMLAIIIIVVAILSLAIGALMYLIYTQRSEEFGILSAMGYRHSYVRNLITKEVLSLNAIGWLIGMLLSVALVCVLNQFVYIPKGQTLTVISLDAVLKTLIIPAMVACFSLVPILLKLRRQDAITVIERRD